MSARVPALSGRILWRGVIALLLILSGLSASAQSLPLQEHLDTAEAAHARARAEVEALATPEAFLASQRGKMSPLSPSHRRARLAEIDLRLVMVQIAQTAGANGQLAVFRAQPQGRQRALALSGGDMTAQDLLDAARALDRNAVGPDGLRMPLLIQTGARLTLSDGAILRLDRHAGAFVANFGRLEIRGGAILATGAPNAGDNDFAPFIVTAGAGRLDAEAALFEGLGFGKEPTFSGVSVVAGGLFRAQNALRLRRSLLRDVQSLHLSSVDDPQITQTRFVDMRGVALQLSGTHGAQITQNIFFGGPQDTLRVSDRALETSLRGNTFYASGGNAIHILGDSHSTDVTDTLVWNAKRSALIADRSDCLRIQRLRALKSGTRGVMLRGTRAAELRDSLLLASGSAGLSVSRQPQGAEVTVTGTRFTANKVGLQTAAPGKITLSGNDFSQQFPRFIKGDLQDNTARLVQDLRGQSTLVLTAGTTGNYLPPLTCALPLES